MANTKISALSSATTPLSGSEIVPINQSGVTDSVSVANLTAGRAVSAASLSLTTTPLSGANGGTGLTSFTSGGVVYANSTSSLATGSVLQFTGSQLLVGTTTGSSGTSVGFSAVNSAGGGFQFGTAAGGGGAITSLSGTGIAFYTYTGSQGSESFSERMRLTSANYLGLGTNSPSALIHASGATASLLRLQNSNSSDDNIQIQLVGSSGNRWLIGNNITTGGTGLNFQIYDWANSALRFTINSSGVVQTYGSATVYTVANATAVFGGGGQTSAIAINSYNDSGKQFVISNNNGNTSVYSGGGTAGVVLYQNGNSWSSFSDERIKDIIEPITNAVNKVSTLRTVIGKYKTDADGVRRPFLIAQDVNAVLPEAIKVNEDKIGTLSLSYTDTIPLLVAAIKELKAEFDAYKASHP